MKRSTLVEAADVQRAIPGVVALELPTNFTIEKHANAWEALYAFVVARVPVAATYRSLHSEVVAGNGAMKRLRDLERARLRARGVRGKKEIEAALSWSDAGSGPMQEVERLGKLDGDVVLIGPEGWRQTLRATD